MEPITQSKTGLSGFQKNSKASHRSQSENKVAEPSGQFESRKKDHIELALKQSTEAIGGSQLSEIQLEHCALPDIDFSDVDISTNIFGQKIATPFLISSMTAGHMGSIDLNSLLSNAAQARGWLMGVGSQRKELFCKEAQAEWKEVRKISPKARLIGNLGLSQIIHTPIDGIKALVDSLEADALFVHTNPLQECLQTEGTPFFAGGFKAIECLCRELSVPVILKETGCGFSTESLEKINGLGLYAVDVAGFGGTHWGRIEGGRNQLDSIKHQCAKSFANWGISTAQALYNSQQLTLDYDIWASGGIRNGVESAKCIAMGAKIVGLAKPLLQAALEGEEKLDLHMSVLEYELKVALFCTGRPDIHSLQAKKVWAWLK